MKTLLRWSAGIVLALLALLAIFVVALAAANWRDDPLTPAAARLLAPPALPVSDAPNAYYVLLGMDAPDGEDAQAAGRRIRAEIDRQFRENPARTDYSQPPYNKAICSSWYDTACSWSQFRCPWRTRVDCVAFYLTAKPRMLQGMAEQAVLRQRYRQFSQIPVFVEPLRHSAQEPWPNDSALMQAAEMRLVEAVLACDSGDLAAGAQILVQEIRVHRRLLADSSQIITKMMAVALLRRDYAVLSNAIEHWPPLARQTALTEAWQPLQAREYDMRREIESDAAGKANLLYQALQTPARSGKFLDRLYAHFGLPNATVNTLARWTAENVRSAEGDPSTADARHRAAIDRMSKEASQVAPYASWRFIRNPEGKTLLLMTHIDWTAYAERIYDLDGYIRLVALQAALQRDGVPLAQVAGYVQRAGPDLRNPYDRQPMQWDAARSMLSFEGRQQAFLKSDDAPKVFKAYLKEQ